ncbi:MAG TPA: hypothetical protein VN222_10590 [Novosphingobium sp.]|nr:hypothetical protein [Novosphingobium sp.]
MTDPVILPAKGGVKTDKPRLIDYGGQLKPFMGGPVQTLIRLGTRWALDITMPIMRTEPAGRQWSAALCSGKLFGVLTRFRQDGLAIGLPGSPVVDDAGQTGMVLAMRGFRPGYTVRVGQFFSIATNGRRYLYMARAAAIAGTDGKMSLPILPMLRVSPADGDSCEFAAPRIQGSLSGNEVSWTRMTAPYCDFGTITITEDE